jgi:hypothetical protein
MVYIGYYVLYSRIMFSHIRIPQMCIIIPLPGTEEAQESPTAG